MSLESRRVATSEVWSDWESQVVNGVFPLRRFIGGSNHSAVFITEFRAEKLYRAAIKLVPADAVEKESQLVQWGTAATLSHPHLLRLFDVGRSHIGGREFLFVVMEYADQTLAQLLPKRALSSDEVREMLLPAIDALKFLHKNNLVHGQIKPSNILVVDDTLKLSSDTLRALGNSTGGASRMSPYDPPELKDSAMSAAGDVWGLGLTAVEALTQRTPAWPEERAESAALPALLPGPFAETLRRCLSRDPAKRPTLSDIETQCRPHPLEQVVAALDPPTSDDTAASDAASGAAHGVAKRRLWVPVVSAVAAVAIISLAAWVSTRSFQTHGETEGSNAEAAGASASSAIGSSAEAAGADVSSAGGSNANGSSAEVRGPGPSGENGSKAAAPGVEALSANASNVGPTSGVGQAGVGQAGGGQADVGQSSTGSSADVGSKSGGPRGAGQSAGAASMAANVGGVSSAILHEVTPEVARNIRERIRGHVNVAVRVLVDRDGNVVGQFLESPGPSRYFARVAGDAAQEWKFVPVEGQGSRVWLLRFQFDRAGATVNASGAQ
jgi:outer membrane biosynthesis protein TonB